MKTHIREKFEDTK